LSIQAQLLEGVAVAKLLRWLSVALIPAALCRAALPEGWQLRNSPAANQLKESLMAMASSWRSARSDHSYISERHRLTQRSAGTSAPQLFTIAHGGGFLCGRGGRALVRVSTDGINWTNGTRRAARNRSLAWRVAMGCSSPLIQDATGFELDPDFSQRGGLECPEFAYTNALWRLRTATAACCRRRSGRDSHLSDGVT
jgi:hypothetical protein